jgi:peptide/nickel transport system permease protein
MDIAPWLAIFPGICITLTVVGFNLLGDGLRDAMDPRRTFPLKY